MIERQAKIKYSKSFPVSIKKEQENKTNTGGERVSIHIYPSCIQTSFRYNFNLKDLDTILFK